MQVNKNIHGIVRRVLNEELGINSEVFKTANQILTLIRQDADKQFEQEEYDEIFECDAYRVDGQISLEFCGVELLVKYESYIFQDQASYSSAIRRYPSKLMNASSISDGTKGILRVSYNRTLENGYDDSICDRIQHELEHTFQSIQKGGVLSNSPLKKRVQNGLSMRGKDDDIFYASWIMYCSRQYEQDACANGLYNWLCNGEGDKNEIVFKSALTKNRRITLKYLQRLNELYNTNDENVFRKFKDFFGIPLKQIIQKGYNSAERMKDLANRVIFKYGKDTGNKVEFIH